MFCLLYIYRIIPRHILLAVHNDEELSKLFKEVTIAQGGVLPNIQSVLLPKKGKENVAPTKGNHSNTLSQEYWIAHMFLRDCGEVVWCKL